MKIKISEACREANDAETFRVEDKPAIPFMSEATIDLESTEKNKNKNNFIAVMCRYGPSAGDSKNKNCVIQAKCLETGSIEYVLCCCMALQKIVEKDPVIMLN